MSVRSTLISAVAILFALIGYRVLVREQPHWTAPLTSDIAIPTPISSDEDRSTIAIVDVAQFDQSSGNADQSGLHQRLLSMAEPYRNHIFALILRDNGFKCVEVLDSELLVVESGAWRADCGEALAYSIVIDEFGSASVRPIQYGDFDE